MFLFSIDEVDKESYDVQIGTTFQIASDSSFNNILFEIKKELPNNIHDIVFDYVLEPLSKYYVRGIRHFEDSNNDEPTESSEVMMDNGIYHRLCYNKENKVEMPWIHVNTEELFNSELDSFTIETSSFKSKVSGHVSTHWFILDGTEQVLFHSINDTVNKTKITIKKTSDILSRNKLYFKVIHVGTEQVESEVGQYMINQDRFNFEVISSVRDITPGKDYELLVRRATEGAIGISMLQVLDDDNKIIYQIPVDQSKNNNDELKLIIPWFLMRYDETIHVVITGLDIGGNLSQRHIYLKTASNNIKEVEDPDFKYKNEISLESETFEKRYSDGVYSIELPAGYIPMVENGKKTLVKYKYDHIGKELVSTGEEVKGANVLSLDNNFTFIKYTENNLLLIDCWRDLPTADGTVKREPVLLVYKHNVHTDIYNLLSMIRHPDTDVKTIENNLIQITPEEFLYFPHRLGKVFKFDVLKSTCEFITDIPLEGLEYSDNLNVFRINNGRIYISGGKDPLSLIYDIDRNNFKPTINYEPMSFYNTLLFTSYLVNGDVLISKKLYPDTDNDSGLILYSNKDRNFINLNKTLRNGETPNGSITLLNNDIILTRRANGTSNSNGKDRYLIYKYN